VQVIAVVVMVTRWFVDKHIHPSVSASTGKMWQINLELSTILKICPLSKRTDWKLVCLCII